MRTNGRIGRLTPMPSGRWGILYEDDHVDEVTSGDVIYVEVSGAGAMAQTRIEFDHKKRQYYSVDGYPLRVGFRAELGSGMRF